MVRSQRRVWIAVGQWWAIVAVTNLVLTGCEGGAPDFMSADGEAASGYLLDEVQEEELKPVNGESFADMYFKHYGVNPTIDTAEEALSTFSVDVDTASYALARSYLERGVLPDEAAVRVEEFVNAFDYYYPAPTDSVFALQAEAVPSPSRPGYQLLHLGIKGRHVEALERKSANLVFVIDTSGSMDMENRIELVKQSLIMLVGQLEEGDRVGIVEYGSSARVILESTGVEQSEKILSAIAQLRCNGSTNAQAGIQLGYRMVTANFAEGGINRVILCSDGVANTGVTTSADGIFETIRNQAEKGVFISTVGFGMGNYNDVLMERLAQIGDGNYSYVDDLKEARRIFVQELTGTLQVIAKDVKIQVEFDPARVERFRLLGYENRALEHEEFIDDSVDAGEIGAGHAVTALYEIKLHDESSGPLAMFRLRYQPPEGGESTLIEKPVPADVLRPDLADGTAPLQLSAVVALFAEKLRGSYWVRQVSWEYILELHASLDDELRQDERVAELEGLIRTAQGLDQREDKFAADMPLVEMEFDRVPILR